MDFVYHSSKTQNLKVIEPKISTHDKEWVYAMFNPDYALMFLGNHGDLINQTGIVDGRPYIAERFAGALEYAYKDCGGSIYKLDAAQFNEGMTSFKAEVVSDEPCVVVEEKQINDALGEILKLEGENKVTLYRYPNLPPWLPADKSDLVEKVVAWYPKAGDQILKKVEQFHPDILDKVKENL